MMSDVAVAFAKAAVTFKFNHVRCLKHFRKQQFEATAGPVGRSKEFIKETNEMLLGLRASAAIFVNSSIDWN